MQKVDCVCRSPPRWFGSLFPVTGLNSRWKLEFRNESQLHVEAFSKLDCWNLHQTKEHTCFLVEEALLRNKSEMIVFSKIILRRLINLLFSKVKRLGFPFSKFMNTVTCSFLQQFALFDWLPAFTLFVMPNICFLSNSFISK